MKNFVLPAQQHDGERFVDVGWVDRPVVESHTNGIAAGMGTCY